MITETNRLLRRAVRLALLTGGVGGAAAFSTTASAAQTATAAAGDEGEVQMQEVVVTGTRIAAPNLDAISPVTAITAEELKETGVTKVEDLLNALPQVVADQGSGLSMGANGIATVNLRGLGVQRTLVLINGRRLAGGDPGAIQGTNFAYASAGDINQVPVALVERVDVLTGGASSTYGADAVSGVVNFVMNDHFEGLRVDANIGIYNHGNKEDWNNVLLSAGGFQPVTGGNWDGANKELTLIMGHNFADGAGNLEGYLGYRRVSGITADHRDHSACQLSDGAPTSSSAYSCGGSSTSAPAVLQNPAIGKKQIKPDGSLGPRYAVFNYGASHYLQRIDERYTAGFFGHMKFNDHVETYTEFTFMSDRTTGNYAPAGSFLGSGQAIDATTGIPDGALSYNCGTGGYKNPGMNPYITAAEFPTLCPETAGGLPIAYTNATNSASATPYFPYQMSANGTGQILVGRRNVEGGPRQDNYTHTSYRGVFGARGEINDTWTYDAYGMYSRTESLDFHNNDTSTQHMQDALLAVPGPGGVPVCQGGQAGCVPWNIFNPAIPVSKAALAYISVPGLFAATGEEQTVEGYVSGDLSKYGIKTPWADEGLKAVLGMDYRRDQINTYPDQEYLSGDLSGIGFVTPPVSAAQYVWEAYTEERLALIHNAPFVKTLDLEAGYRYSNYNVGYTTNTYKFGVEWAPTSDVRLRASYNRAVRAPNLQELYQPDHVALDGSGDLCAQGTALTAAQCANLGLTAAQYALGGAAASPAHQYNGLLGGNPKITPEVGQTYEVGLVFTPTMLPNFNATVDYSDIKITNLINSYGASTIQSNCLLTGAPIWCSLIHRDPAGTLWASHSAYVIDPVLNTGGLEYRGLDLGVAYKFGLGAMGQLRARLDGTWLHNLIYTPNTGRPYDCAGRFGNSCSPITPSWRHRMTLDWDSPINGLSGGIIWRFFGKGLNTFTDPKTPDFSASAIPLEDARIPNYSFFDVHVSYRYEKATLRVGVNNLLDKDPPVIAGGTQGNSIYAESNTYPSVYDTLGRFLFAQVTVDF